MAKALRGCTIAITGDFGPDRTIEKVEKWIRARGGKFKRSIDSYVTHLVCSVDSYKQEVLMVKQAAGRKAIKIVTFDWLEDSLLKQSPQRTKDYLLRTHLKNKEAQKGQRKAKRIENIRKGVAKFEKNCQEFRKYMRADGYEIYRDSTGLIYDVTLARVDLAKNANERWHLKLFQTHSAPRHYACFAVYSSPGSKPLARMLAPVASHFETAMSQFTEFFKLKTRMEWADRFKKAPEEEGGVLDGTVPELPFRYARPERYWDPRRPDVEW